MRIKRIEADNITEAMRELRRELGEGALILHTKQLPPRGVAGWFKSPRVEILGAIDEPELAGSPKASVSAGAGVSASAQYSIRQADAPAAETAVLASGQPAKTKERKKQQI